MKDALLDSLVGKDISIKFKLEISQQPVGPGKLESFEVEYGEITGSYSNGLTGETRPTYNTRRYYKLLVPAMAHDQQGRPTGKKYIMPLVFEADDVLYIAEDAIVVDDPAIVTPENGARTAGGLHIPGRG